ncbi:MAG: fibronectin type III domain-containing protein [Bacteroidia bacterium]|nr:fibronectin type III domain-containing protein [Bacteroidia bacterium]
MKKNLLVFFLVLIGWTSNAQAACSVPRLSTFGTINKTASSATIYWNSISGASSYDVRWKIRTSSASWSTPASVSSTIYTITGLTPSTNYEFQVRANCGSGGTSAYSSSGWFTTIAGSATCSVIPNAAQFTSTNRTSASATLNWASTGASSYNLRWKASVSSTWSSTIAVNGLLHNLTGLTPSTTYEFQVQSNCGSIGLSAFSTSGTFSTTAVVSSCTSVPDVNQFGTINKTGSSATVYWRSTSGATAYNLIWRVRVPAGTWNSPVNVTGVQYNITGLNSSTNYEFQVQTICAAGVSAYSPSGWFTTTTGGAVCGVPSSLGTGSISSSEATLTWSAVSGSGSYAVQYRVANGTWFSTNSTTNSVVLSGLTPGASYEYQVQAVCGGVAGALSAIASFSTSGVVVNSPVPVYDKVVVVVFENTSINTITNGYGTLSTFELLANEGALFTESYGMHRPSQPNYFDLFAGTNMNWTSNNPAPGTPFTSSNIGAAVLNAGKTFGSYCQGLPTIGSQVVTSGLYDRKHNYVASWQGTGGGNMIPADYNMPLTSLPTNYANLPNFSIIVPDRCASMHDDCTGSKLGQAQTFMNQYIMSLYQYLKANNGLLVVTFDEGAADQHIWTCIAGANVVQGSYNQGVDHFSFLRMFYQTMGLNNYAGGSASRADIANCWTTSQRLAKSDDNVSPELVVYPNPFEAKFRIEEEGTELVQVIDIQGRIIFYQEILLPAELDLSNQNHGVYFLRIGDKQKKLIKL